MDKFYDAADDTTDGMPVKDAPEAVAPTLEAKVETYRCVFGKGLGRGRYLAPCCCMRRCPG